MVRKKAAKKSVSKKRVVKKSVAKKRVVKKGVTKKTARRTTKKAVVGASRSTTKKPAIGTSLVTEMEQVATKTRDQLAKAHEKEVALRKKMVEKMQRQLAKALEKQQTLKQRKVAAIEKATEKGTQGARNQVVRAREALRELNTRIKSLRNEVREAKLTHKSASGAHSKFVAAEKALERFERDWSKKLAPKRKVTRRTRKTPVAAATADKKEPTTETVSPEAVSNQSLGTETTENG